ncbi:MAG: hypothetical protein DRQ98_11760 [Gammaproteobacteria bacterium]|nr:MAG: hypothetical protein DRQ98_11760 [Gammaproteobacteria bacterium]
MAGDLTIEVDGLKESIRFLGKVGKDLRKEAVNIIKENTVRVKSEAQAKMQTSPGVQRNGYPLTKTAIIHRASGKGASVGINRASSKGRNAAIFPAEFGTYQAMVPVFRGRGRAGGRRWMGQNEMRRRTFPVWRGNQFKPRGRAGPGWIVQPTIRKWMPKFDKQLAEDLMPVFNEAARRAGVPRG